MPQKVYQYPVGKDLIVLANYHRQTATDKNEIIAKAKNVIADMQQRLQDPNIKPAVAKRCHAIISTNEELIEREQKRLDPTWPERQSAAEIRRLQLMQHEIEQKLQH